MRQRRPSGRFVRALVLRCGLHGSASLDGMNLKRIVAITAAGAVVAGGAGVAIGATTGKKAEQQVLADAAKRLDTTPEKLRAALAAAQDAQLDKAVKAGELTQEQADRMKAARKARGSVLGGSGIGH